jgi:hypothetical protein
MDILREIQVYLLWEEWLHWFTADQLSSLFTPMDKSQLNSFLQE